MKKTIRQSKMVTGLQYESNLVGNIFEECRVSRYYCNDCGIFGRVPSVHYTWVSRCGVCSKAFDAANYERMRIQNEKMRIELAEHIANECPDDGIVCQECCGHEFDSSEGFMCIECDKEPW